MRGYLIDTNVLSELRKPGRNAAVVDWFSSIFSERLYLSVLTLGELRRGVEMLRIRDAHSAGALDRWIAAVRSQFSDRIIGVDEEVAERWGQMSPRRPVPVIDGLLAATALAHDLAVVTRNTADFERSGVTVLNPFDQKKAEP